ncbi:Cysteine-rich receptor-like protein kinase 3 [Ananas comosus]|uniref:Cysteine-rich receptor-like protein kinase 3 n=1 Tax=Ananas comosus TaxID=4615 RepID=A0A199W3G3_ANACO|nr:Cysteine-rich receptor-like protein kinase 3 [Ananas comosus]
MKPSSLFLFLLLLPTATATAAVADDDAYSPAVILTVCGPAPTPDPTAFDINFATAMETLHQNISASGYGTTVAGAGAANAVYAVSECFAYVSPTACQLCYAEIRLDIPRCLPADDSRVYLDGCFGRYAGRNVTGDAVDAADAAVCGNASVDAEEAAAFRDAAARLVGNLTTAAVTTENYYQAGSARVAGAGASGLTVYGVAQCWRWLNASGCQKCLQAARANVTARCLPATDGQALNAGCFVRYSTDPFYLNSTSSSSSSSSSGRTRLIIALTLTSAAVAALLVIVIWIKINSRTNLTDDTDGSRHIIRRISASHLSFKYEDLRKATDNFNLINKLGQGGFGSVYKGVLPDGKEIAVKRLFFNATQRADQFFNEVSLVSRVQHKNLVKLLGCSIEGPESLLVYEFLCNTSLDSFLFDSFKRNVLDWEKRLEIIVGTAEGLSYLHNASEVRIIHRDIKASNILLDERFKPKIADFGLARYFMEDQSHLSTGIAGTFGYMAPEYIVHGQLTEKADIYSYGILVLEIVTGRKNNNSVDDSPEGQSLMSQIWRQFKSRTLIEMLDPCLRNRCSDEEALKVFQVGLLCSQASPNLRPPMWKVVEMLNSGSKELPSPTQPPFIDIKGSNANKSNSSESSSLLSSSSKSPFSLNKLSVSDMEAK